MKKKGFKTFSIKLCHLMSIFSQQNSLFQEANNESTYGWKQCDFIRLNQYRYTCRNNYFVYSNSFLIDLSESSVSLALLMNPLKWCFFNILNTFIWNIYLHGYQVQHSRAKESYLLLFRNSQFVTNQFIRNVSICFCNFLMCISSVFWYQLKCI